jgi:hypothetical protein
LNKRVHRYCGSPFFSFNLFDCVVLSQRASAHCSHHQASL